MSDSPSRRSFAALVLFASVWCTPGLALGADATDARPPASVDLELGLYRYSRNDVRIPNVGGTRFDLTELAGDSGADVRLHGTWWWSERNALRLTLAPINTNGTGVPDQNIDFAGSEFAAGEPTRAQYRFNTYRLTWRYRFYRGERWEWGAGAAVLVRDARIRLTQDGVTAQDDDLGVVPLLHVHGRYAMTPRTTLVLDIEGAGASQGRAIDAALRVEHGFDSGWFVHGGYRTLEGGADVDDIYAFAWLHFATLGFGYRF